MHTIQTQVKVNRDHILNLVLPEDITEGTYQVVIVMNPQPDNEHDNDDTPDEIVLEGIKEGLKQAISGQTIPLSQMWEGIDIQDGESYQQVLDKIELLESLAGIRKSLEEFEQGKGVPLNQALAEFQEKYE